MRQTKFIEMSLKDLASRYGVAGLELSKIIIAGVEMPHGGKVRFTMRHRCEAHHDPLNGEWPIYFYSDFDLYYKWLVNEGCVLYPLVGNPIKVIGE